MFFFNLKYTDLKFRSKIADIQRNQEESITLYRGIRAHFCNIKFKSLFINLQSSALDHRVEIGPTSSPKFCGVWYLEVKFETNQ